MLDWREDSVARGKDLTPVPSPLSPTFCAGAAMRDQRQSHYPKRVNVSTDTRRTRREQVEGTCTGERSRLWTSSVVCFVMHSDCLPPIKVRESVKDTSRPKKAPPQRRTEGLGRRAVTRGVEPSRSV